MRFGGFAKVPAKCMLEYYRISKSVLLGQMSLPRGKATFILCIQLAGFMRIYICPACQKGWPLGTESISKFSGPTKEDMRPERQQSLPGCPRFGAMVPFRAKILGCATCRPWFLGAQ